MFLQNISTLFNQAYIEITNQLKPYCESETTKKILNVTQVLFGIYGVISLRQIYLKDKEIKISGQLLTRNQRILRFIHILGALSLIISSLTSPLFLLSFKRGVEYLSSFEKFRHFSLKSHSLSEDNLLYFIRLGCVIAHLPLSLKRTYDFCILSSKFIKAIKENNLKNYFSNLFK